MFSALLPFSMGSIIEEQQMEVPYGFYNLQGPNLSWRAAGVTKIVFVLKRIYCAYFLPLQRKKALSLV